MISRKEAETLVKNNIYPLSSMLINVEDSIHYVLDQDIISPIDLPSFDKSCMDGYAILSQDESQEFDVIGTIKAGDNPTYHLSEGKAVKIMTGAKTPTENCKIIKKEDIEEVSETRIRIVYKSEAINITLKGDFISKGTLVYKPGQLISEIVLANLISLGIPSVKIYKKPNVAIITTGNELLEPGEIYQEGKIYNSNGPLLKSLLIKNYIKDVEQIRCADDREALKKVLQKALATNDMIIFSGGISVGDYDYTRPCLEECGAELIFHKVQIKPGKPVGFFIHNQKPIFALPGNPVSLLLTFYLFVKPALKLMQGTYQENNFIEAQTEQVIERKSSDREEFIPIYYINGKQLSIGNYLGSAHLLGLNGCNGFLNIPKGIDRIEKGSLVQLTLY